TEIRTPDPVHVRQSRLVGRRSACPPTFTRPQPLVRGPHGANLSKPSCSAFRSPPALLPPGVFSTDHAGDERGSPRVGHGPRKAERSSSGGGDAGREDRRGPHHQGS